MSTNIVSFPLDKMKNIGKSINKKSGDDHMEIAVLLAINKKMYDSGLITKEEKDAIKEAIDIEISREK